MTFDRDIDAFLQKAELRRRLVFLNTAAAVKDSVVSGSPVTGAPGQPVDVGTLRDSWILEFPGSESALVSTNLEYAPEIEHNLRGASLRSQVGGFHSVKLTVAGFERLVDDVARKVAL